MADPPTPESTARVAPKADPAAHDDERRATIRAFGSRHGFAPFGVKILKIDHPERERDDPFTHPDAVAAWRAPGVADKQALRQGPG